jgi:hypothetical protein
VEPDYDELDLATGDIVLAKTGAGESDWFGVAVVIKPPDLGASRPGRPVVLTSLGRVGEIGSALPGMDDDNLVIVAGDHERPGELLDQIKAVITADAKPADETGATLITELGGGLETTRSAVPVRGLTSLHNVSRYLTTARVESALSYRRCPWGDPMPCQHSLGRPK